MWPGSQCPENSWCNMQWKNFPRIFKDTSWFSRASKVDWLRTCRFHGLNNPSRIPGRLLTSKHQRTVDPWTLLLGCISPRVVDGKRRGSVTRIISHHELYGLFVGWCRMMSSNSSHWTSMTESSPWTIASDGTRALSFICNHYEQIPSCQSLASELTMSHWPLLSQVLVTIII